MKIATIVYHKNINSIYKKEWIDKSYSSILNQTYKNFIIYELNYGDDEYRLHNDYPNDKKNKYFKKPFENHADAMNFLLQECLKDKIDFVFNNNIDDFNNEKRFEIQLEKIKSGYDIVSSNFIHIDSDNIEIRKMDMSSYDIQNELDNDHNIICHPSICYSKNFIKKNKYISDEIPKEDLNLWKRTIKEFKFFICPEYLINYRVHNNQVSFVQKKSPIILESSVQENIVPKIDNQVNQNYINMVNHISKINNIDKCYCGEIKNKRKYNFCQKCNKLY